ncbi:hypothetical protein GCM10027347_47930 [Larkinella harenae]
MNQIIRLFSICLVLLFSACDKNNLKPDIITMQVADKYRDCMSVGPQKCLWVKMEDEANWSNHYFGIEGFTYEEGYQYTLTVRRKHIKNPKADGPSIRYILVNVVEKTKV